MSYIGILTAFVGLVLSVLLIQEYFGNAGSLANSLCSAAGDGSGCKKVAESAYSGFSIPLLGKIPVALFGFTFYGFIGYLFFMISRVDDDNERLSYIGFGTFLSTVALFIDLILLYVSVGIIGAVCPLCAITYGVSLVLLLLFFIQYQKEKRNESLMTYFTRGLKMNILNFLIVSLAFFACGLGIGQFSQGTNKESIASGDANEEEIKLAIQAYKSAPVVNISTDKASMLGDPNARITIVKYADYNCGHCMHASKILKRMLSEFSGIIKVYYKNFPLDGNCNRLVQRKSPNGSSCIAASASICANKQSKFLEMYTGLYGVNESGGYHTAATTMEIAKSIKLDIPSFQTCLNSAEVREQINREVDEAEKLNIQSTPSLYINNKPLTPGTPDPNFLRELIKELMKQS